MGNLRGRAIQRVEIQMARAERAVNRVALDVLHREVRHRGTIVAGETPEIEHFGPPIDPIRAQATRRLWPVHTPGFRPPPLAL